MTQIGLLCPSCGSDDLIVVDSRPRSQTIKRRRACQNCELRFTTSEISVRDDFFKMYDGVVNFEEMFEALIKHFVKAATELDDAAIILNEIRSIHTKFMHGNRIK